MISPKWMTTGNDSNRKSMYALTTIPTLSLIFFGRKILDVKFNEAQRLLLEKKPLTQDHQDAVNRKIRQRVQKAESKWVFPLILLLCTHTSIRRRCRQRDSGKEKTHGMSPPHTLEFVYPLGVDPSFLPPPPPQPFMPWQLSFPVSDPLCLPLRILMVLSSDFNKPIKIDDQKTYEKSIPFTMDARTKLALKKNLPGFLENSFYDAKKKLLQTNCWVRPFL
jgi:hypothetical protein